MAATHRIKSAEGRWLDCEHLYGESFNWTEWIPAPLLSAWTSAKKSSPACARAVELCKQLGGAKSSYEEVKEPLTEDAKRKVELGLAGEKAKFAAEFKKTYGASIGSDTVELYWREREKQSREALLEKVTIKHATRWVKAPMTSWQTAPGRATLASFEDAQKAISFAKAAVELEGLITQANADAKKLGIIIPAWAKAKKLSAGARELAGSSLSAFEAVAELEQKDAIALFADQWDRSGFIDRKGLVKPDIAEACLFPDLKAAKLFARHHAQFPVVKAVSVRVSVISYEPFQGGPSPCSQLDAVMASREAKQIEAALSEAKIEALEAELSRRRMEAGEDAKPKPSAPRI